MAAAAHWKTSNSPGTLGLVLAGLGAGAWGPATAATFLTPPGQAPEQRTGASQHSDARQVHRRIQTLQASVSARPSGVAVPLAVLSCCLLAARRRSQRPWCKRGSQSVRQAARAKAEAMAVATALVDDEIAALEREAALLRASAAELEEARAEQQLQERRQWFKIFDKDGSGGVDVSEMRSGMREFSGIEIDEDKASRLVQVYDRNQNGVLEFEEFDLPSFQATLEKLWAEDRAREEAAFREEQQRLAESQLELEMKEYYSTLAGPNTDTGLLTRFGSVLAYLLPLLDGLRFALPLVTAAPALRPLLTLLMGPVRALNAIPFGQVIVFIAMQVVAGNRETPALLRFNLRQAIVLDVALFLPSLLASMVEFITQDELPQEVRILLGAAVFVPLCACLLYSAGCSILGIAPRGIPGLSEAAERSMGMVPPDRRNK